MIIAFLALAAPFFAVPEGRPPDPPTHGGSGFERPSRVALDLAYEGKAAALRDEMHALQQSDGGELTAEHRAYVREKLEALLSAYRRDVGRDDPWVNADGTPVR